MKLPAADLVVLVAYLLATVAFGLWMGRRQRDAADFMVSGRSLPWWLVLFSIVATETSTVTFLSIPGFAYGNDLTWLQLPLGFVVGRLVVVAVLLPRYFQGQLFTAYQVLDERFGGATKQVASLLFVVTRTLADGLRLFLSAIVLQEVAGIPIEQAVIVLGVATIVYTFLGGIRAVVWTDFVQFVVYVAGAAIAFAVLLSRIDGGFEEFLAAGSDADKFRMLDFGFDVTQPYRFWAGLVGGAFLSAATHGVDQMWVQRYLCARSRAAAGWALGLSGVVVWLQFGFFLCVGVALFVFYRQQDPVPTFDKADRVFATFIVDELPTGVLGIVLGAVFAAAMSTLSSSLNSSATALMNDVWGPLVRPGAGEREKLRTLRAFTIVFGVLQIGVGIAGQGLDESVVNSVLAIAGFTTGLILGVFLLGVLTRRVAQRDALCGLVVGLGVMTWVYFGTAIAWPWYTLIGSSCVFVSGVLARLVIGEATR